MREAAIVQSEVLRSTISPRQRVKEARLVSLEQRLTKLVRKTDSGECAIKELFIWIPKSAGTTIFHSLNVISGALLLKSPRSFLQILSASTLPSSISTGHMDPDFLVRTGIMSRQQIEGIRAFTIVRNPYDRAKSLYNYLRARNRFDNRLSFPGFLEVVRAGRHKVGPWNTLGLSQTCPQVTWQRPRLWAGPQFLRLENPEDFDQFGLPNPRDLPHLNQSVGSVDDEWTLTSRRLVQDIYREDFEEFGYDS